MKTLDHWPTVYASGETFSRHTELSLAVGSITSDRRLGMHSKQDDTMPDDAILIVPFGETRTAICAALTEESLESARAWALCHSAETGRDVQVESLYT